MFQTESMLKHTSIVYNKTQIKPTRLILQTETIHKSKSLKWQIQYHKKKIKTTKNNRQINIKKRKSIFLHVNTIIKQHHNLEHKTENTK